MSLRASTTTVASREAIWLGDAARGLCQQMVFWGHDVRHPAGNWLVAHGMERKPSPGITGTSCYSTEWENGRIELHGAVASWTSADSNGCVFNRDHRRILLWNEGHAPVPGIDRGTGGSPRNRWSAFQPLLRWLIAYEKQVTEQLGPSWREANWRAVKKLPHSPAWLPPAAALAWWEAASHGTPPRPKSLLPS